MKLVLLFLLLFQIARAMSRCHSCLTHCKIQQDGKVDAKTCDCTGTPEESCLSHACFAKVELFAEEKTAILQKGCITELPGGQIGCQYASNAETVHCFCEGDLCNSRHTFADFIPSKLPTVECCGCSERHGDKCPQVGCLNKCRGNYCVVDFDGVEQGCGLGYPRLQSFLRLPSYLDWQGEPICARYEAGPSTVMNGCTCTGLSGSCNELNRTKNYQLTQVLDRSNADLQYCYSLSHKSSKPFGEEVFRKATTCEGQYCFISLTTSEIVLESSDFEHSYDDHEEFVGLARPKYELLAGCLKKISLGCTTEFSQNVSDPLSKHCICNTHLCNFYHQISGKPDPRPRVNKEEDRDSNSVQQSPAKNTIEQLPEINASSASLLVISMLLIYVTL